MMFKSLISATLAACLSLPAAAAENYAIAVPQALPGGGDSLQPHLWSVFIDTLGPGDHYQLLNATTPGLVATLDIPDEAKYARARWRAKDFRQENARIAAHLGGITVGTPQIDLMGSLRHVALNRIDPDAPLDLLIIGSVVQRLPDEPAFDMTKGGELLVPSPAHLLASVTETPYGMGSEGETGLSDVSVHLCPVGTDLSSNAEAAYQRFFGAYIAARGGALVSWSDNLPTCFERFEAGIRAPINVEPYGDHDTDLSMLEINRSPVVIEVTEPTTTIVNGIEIDQFNLFSGAPHPTLSSVEVTTGVVYEPGKYPEVYKNAYCYFPVRRNGTTIRFDLGNKGFGQNIVWDSAPRAALRSAGITASDFEAGKSACQWPNT